MTPAETAFRTVYALAGGKTPTRTAIGGRYIITIPRSPDHPGGVRWFDREIEALAWKAATDPDLNAVVGDALDKLLAENSDLAATLRSCRWQ